MYYAGEGVEKNKSRAYRLFRQSAEQGNSDAEKALQELKSQNKPIDTITFAGNGEPTMHPEFKEIIEDTIILRNQYASGAVISVLSNAWHISNPNIFSALRKIDNNILKLDSAIKETIITINQPNNTNFEVEDIIKNLTKFNGECIIQTLFVRGYYNGKKIDNTTEEEIEAWLNALKIIQPKQVMIYAIDRATPVKTLEKIPLEELKSIAARGKKLGFDMTVSA